MLFHKHQRVHDVLKAICNLSQRPFLHIVNTLHSQAYTKTQIQMFIFIYFNIKSTLHCL